MAEIEALERLLNERFETHLRALCPEVPAHRIEFSRRITESWALIYYRRHLVRLSPYLFLLDPDALAHGSHWRELDATLRHEAAHAYAFHHHGHAGHSQLFHDALAKLGLHANGSCDLGPENAAFRYVYACPSCGALWHRRAALRGNYSCGACAPGRFDARYKLELKEQRNIGARLRERRAEVIAALAEGMLIREHEQSLAWPVVSSSSATPPPAPQASP